VLNLKKIQISDHFKISTMLLFSLPSIGMQIVDNTYQIADGYFISNYISEEAFEAENLIFPVLLIVMYVGLMFGTGASALISKELGEGKKERANQLLSMSIAVLTAVGLILSAALFILMPTICRWVGATEEMMDHIVVYGRVLACFMPFQMLSMAFHPLLITANRPGLGLVTTISNATVNILLDYLFVAVFGWGMRGAAIATGIAWLVSAIVPLVFFINKKHPLHFVRPCRDLGALGRTLYNGASEMVDGVSYAIVAMIFNLQLLRWMGNAGVGAYAVSEYVSGLFMAIFYGISMSIVPVVGYQLGRKDVSELRSLRRNGFVLMSGLGIIMTGLGIGLADPVSRLFVGYNEQLTALSVEALRIISFSYLLNGVTTFSSSYFTGLNQGSASLAIAAVKGFIGPLAAVFTLPLIIGPKGMWFSTPAAEILAMITAAALFLWWKKREASGDLPEPDEEYQE
jgi:putative MATE family efflux protein